MNSLISPHQSHQKEKTWLGFCVPHRAPVLFHRVFSASLDTPQFFEPQTTTPPPPPKYYSFPLLLFSNQIPCVCFLVGGWKWDEVGVRSQENRVQAKFIVLCQGLCFHIIHIANEASAAIHKMLKTTVCKRAHLYPIPTFILWDSKNMHNCILPKRMNSTAASKQLMK